LKYHELKDKDIASGKNFHVSKEKIN